MGMPNPGQVETLDSTNLVDRFHEQLEGNVLGDTRCYSSQVRAVADVTGIGYCRIIFRSKANIPKFKHVKMWNLNRKIADFRQSFAYFLKLKFFEMKPDQR